MSEHNPQRPMGTHGSGGKYCEHGTGSTWAPSVEAGHVKIDDQHKKSTPSDEKQYKDLPAAEVYHDYISKKPEEHHKHIHLQKSLEERAQNKNL